MSTIHGNETMVPAGSRRERASKQKGSRLGLIIGAVVVAIAVGLGGGYLLFRDDAPAKPSSDTAATALAAGLQAVIQGNTAKATTKFREVVAIDPKNKLAYYNLALIEQNAKAVTAAETDYRKTIAIDPNYAPALYNLGIIRADAGAPVEAIGLYRQATVADPTFARAFLNLGLLLFDNGDPAGAATALSKAVQLDPTLASRIPENERSGVTTPAN
jgi:Tfp pilus assembly protein PilF